ncbi:endolytic transglycosylase MltG [Thiohalorhabdus sp.]|uniref:endolytic transglycosylase MltG n=1 Tax=Thiohalorhabdus sp. TaxID=3094134 RepID=UPI002FC367B9
MPNPLREWKRWLFLALVLGLVALGLAGRHVYQVATSPMALAEKGILEVPEGAGYNRVIQRLADKGWVNPGDILALKVLGRVLGVTAQIHAGEYRLSPQTKPLGLLNQLVSGDVIMHSLTLPEGRTVRDFLTRLRESESLATQDLPDGPEDQELVALLGLAERGHDSAEGWFFPETYRFSRGRRAKSILTQAHERMRSVLEKEWGNRAEDLPLDDAYQALILASIVEKETAAPSERALIAGVFVNRLRQGMRLQTDPTVIYGLGNAFDGNLQHQDLRRPTPYNTYTQTGLPPTPIANPGRAAIRAACQPADTDYRYFVSSGDGSHVFSETLAEHNRAVQRFQLGGQ